MNQYAAGLVIAGIVLLALVTFGVDRWRHRENLRQAKDFVMGVFARMKTDRERFLARREKVEQDMARGSRMTDHRFKDK